MAQHCAHHPVCWETHQESVEILQLNELLVINCFEHLNMYSMIGFPWFVYKKGVTIPIFGRMNINSPAMFMLTSAPFGFDPQLHQ